MELVVDYNSYIDIAEANEMMKFNFLSNNKLRKLWFSLDDDDKTSLLLSSHRKFDNSSMLYQGFKADACQNLEFPRVYDNGGFLGVPYDIKMGILLAGLTDLSDESSEEFDLQSKGVKTYKIKDASVEFTGAPRCKINGIDSEIFDKYFSRYTLIS